MTVLAYTLIILPISVLVVMFLGVTLGATLGWVPGVFAFGLSLFWIPEKQRALVICFQGTVIGFLCGVLGEVAGFGFDYLIFRWLVGPNSFTVLPICVAAIPLLLPPIYDFVTARKVEATLAGLSECTSVTVLVESTWGAAIGLAVGWVGGIVFFGVALRSIW